MPGSKKGQTLGQILGGTRDWAIVTAPTLRQPITKGQEPGWTVNAIIIIGIGILILLCGAIVFRII
jgi:hypothetical protein